MRGKLYAVEYFAYGVRFRFTAESIWLLEKMKLCMPWSAEECDIISSEISNAARFVLESYEERFRLTCDGIAMGDVRALEEVLEQLKREVMLHVADHAPDRVFVHAGVIEWRGKALLLPGTSFAGKTTLVAALVRAGATYYSDEYAVLDARGRVHPYAQELRMREPGEIAQRTLTVRELKGKTGVTGVPASYVVFAEFVDGAKWRPEAMSPGRALLAMMEHSIAVQRAPARVMAALSTVVETARTLRCKRGDADLTASILLETMSSESEG